MLLALLTACSDYELDKRSPEPEVPLPEILVEPSQLDWDTLGLNCVDEQVVTVTNIGAGPLTVSGTYAEGNPAWTAEMATGTLAPAESLTFTVRFSPATPGDQEGTIVVNSDDPEEPEVEVPSEGTAVAEGLVSDRFIQEASPVDVVWVIDNSGSMAQEQARVSAAINSFFAWFTTLNLDYQMGVITTDVVNPVYSGRLVGAPTFITPATPSPEAELAEAIQVGTEDMGDESGLAATELAFSEPVLSAENAGFMRPDANLVIVYLSDEPEFSAPDSAHYISFLQGLKADPSDILVSAIVGDYGTGCSNTCDDAAQDAQPGDKYLDVVTAFSGVFGSICTCDLAPILSEIGLEATRYVRTFALTSVPTDPTAIAVFVEGIENTDWTWEAATNEIVFTLPPLNGDEIIVRYPTTMTCE
jgi:hypothetical protein